jgi:hypothetical protein
MGHDLLFLAGDDAGVLALQMCAARLRAQKKLGWPSQPIWDSLLNRNSYFVDGMLGSRMRGILSKTQSDRGVCSLVFGVKYGKQPILARSLSMTCAL